MNAPDRIFAEEPDVFDGMGLWHSEGPYAEYIRADLHDTALAAAKAEGIREGMLKAAEIADNITKVKGIEGYAPVAIRAEAGRHVAELEIRVSGPDSSGEYWLHLTGANKEACGISLGSPIGSVSRKLLSAAAGKS